MKVGRALNHRGTESAEQRGEEIKGMASVAASRRVAARPRRWIVFFVLLAGLAALGVVLPIVYNLGQQLRPEQLAAAKELWGREGPADYDLTYTVQYDREREAERHVVVVRGGRVVWASCEGEVVQVSPAVGAAVGVTAGGTLRGGRDVPAIFARLEGLLAEEGEAGRRNFLVAVFDPKAGWPRRIIRRVRGTSTREEWNLRVWPAGEVERQARR